MTVQSASVAPHRSGERPRPVIDFKSLKSPIIIAVAYLAAAECAFLIGTFSDKIFAPFWPPNAILLCTLLLTERRRWWAFLAAVAPAHAIAELGVGMPWPAIVVAYLTNAGYVVASVLLLQRFSASPPYFNNLRDASFYILVASLAVPGVVALGGAFVPILSGGSWDDYWPFWALWFASNTLGSLTITPAALLYFSDRNKSIRPALSLARSVEAIMLGAILFAVCALAFEVREDSPMRLFIPTLIYSPLPLVGWATVRFGVRGATAATLIITVVLVWRTLSGANLFSSGTPEHNVFALQLFLIGLSSLILLLGASIEETKIAEQSVRESEARTTFATATVGIGIWGLDGGSRRIWMTDHCKAMFGIEKSEKVSRARIARAVHPDDRIVVLKRLKTLACQGMPADFEFRVLRFGEELKWYRARAQSTFDQNRGAHISGVFFDVTDRKQMESEADLQRQEITHLMRVSMLGELSGGIAHELTQPLTAILSNAEAAREMLLTQKHTHEEISELIEDIISDDNRAGAVLQRMRSLLRKSRANYEPTDIADLVGATLRLLHSEFITHRVAVRFDAEPDLPLVSSDAVQIQQVLLNLIMNAIEAMTGMPPARRIVGIKVAETANGHVEISIRDQGPGIQEASLDQVLKPFFTTKERGLGLGLSICLSIVKSHGGTLNLSDNDGAGLTAKFTLPGRNVLAQVS